MSNPNPSPATRWPKGCSGNISGRISRRWVRRIMAERDADGQPYREAIIRHLIEVATQWQIIHLGKEYDVASGRDSVEAAKLLMAYDLGTPPKTPSQLELAEHLRQVSRDQWGVLVQALGDRLKTMTPDEIAEVITKADLSPERFLAAARQQMRAPKTEPIAATTVPAIEAPQPTDKEGGGE